MLANGERPNAHSSKNGRLTIVGTGIAAITQMSAEVLSHIRHADVIFYHVTNGVTATQLRKLNSRVVDLYEYYDDGKERKVTYVQMAELMLREVRKGLSVVGVFHGHPGFFVSPARRALAIASAEGHDTALLPAISAPDCLFADLRVDPGVFGCQIMMASRVMAKKAIIASTGHVILLQVSAVGDAGFSFSGYKDSKLGSFFERLIKIYGEEQDAVYYMAAVFPGLKPEIKVHKLVEYRKPEIQATVHAGMLYLPPKGISFAELTSVQAFRGGEAYGSFETAAVTELDEHVTPVNFLRRKASDALFDAMVSLGTNPDMLTEYRDSPEAFIRRFPDLSGEEQRALRLASPGALRKVTAT